MAEIIIPVLRIASILCSCNGNNTWYLCDLQENKDALNTAMEELKDTRDDVKRKVVEAENNPNEPMECNKEVSGWLERVQAIEGEVVQVIQKADKEIKGRCFGGYCSINCWSRYKIGKLVTETLAIVKDSRIKGSFVDVAHKLPPPLVEKEAVELTLGMESMFDKVWRLLAKDEVRIMGLYGYGGVGKTTLLKQINNEFLKSITTTSSSSSTYGFDVVILVVVSKALNIVAIQKEIGDRLGLLSPNRKNICIALSKKNFLLLLDDIWERVDLQSIGIPLENNKSKVVFTTRFETVCELMKANEMLKVQCLPWNEAWSLFQEEVGERALNSHPDVPELAKVVARKCGGLPLALITIGRAMSTKKTVQAWSHAITQLRKSASELPGMGDEVLPLLKLSYDNLRDDMVKSCFLYCALFPEDKSINKAKLIDYWIGEGLILLNEFDHIDEARNHGYDVIGILKGACLLESGGQHEESQETKVKMHDTIRDLALWIARECGSRSRKRDKMLTIESFDGTSDRLWYDAERIYLGSLNCSITEYLSVPIPPPPKSPKLLTLICRTPYFWSAKFFQSMPRLRVLDLTGGSLHTFPTCITELTELQYLSLSKTNIKVLPEELGKLVKLNYLNLSHIRFLKEIPSGVIGSLSELRVLNLYGCYAFWDLDEVYRLKHLNDLGLTINRQQNLKKILSNQKLQMCTRHLRLSSSPSQNLQLGIPHRLSLSPLQKLQLCSPSSSTMFSSSSSSSTTTTLGVHSTIKSLEKLELLSNLERLSLFYLPRTMNMGVWENHYYMAQHHHLHSYFQNLSRIEIGSCNGLKDLTWVGYMGNLKTLEVSRCEELEVIVIVVDDFGGTGTGGDEISTMMNNVDDVFKRLETLNMIELPKLKSVCSHALAFPCLETMIVAYCPELKKLPFDSGSNLNSTLRKIAGGPKWWNELQWEEDHDNNELLKSKFLPYFDGIWLHDLRDLR